MKLIRAKARSDEGSAFVISILILFVLSVLGLALMLSTSTEQDIAVNYRWGEQAFFNADAGLQYGKAILARYALISPNSDFSLVLPTARANVQVNPGDPQNVHVPAMQIADDCADPTTAGCRDYQYFVDQCVAPGVGPCTRVYIGRVLRRAGGVGPRVQYDFRAPPAEVAGDFVTEDGSGLADIEGTVTLWVRRPIVGTQDYGAGGTGLSDRVILTAEGTAPHGELGRPASIRRLEMSVRLPGVGIKGNCTVASSEKCEGGGGPLGASGGTSGASQTIP